jgi:hypothetical protein
LQKPVACPGLVSSRSPGRLKLKELRKPGNVFNEFPILATAAHKEILILLLSRGRGKIADVARHVTTFNPAKPKAGVSGDPHDIRKNNTYHGVVPNQGSQTRMKIVVISPPAATLRPPPQQTNTGFAKGAPGLQNKSEGASLPGARASVGSVGSCSRAPGTLLSSIAAIASETASIVAPNSWPNMAKYRSESCFEFGGCSET